MKKGIRSLVFCLLLSAQTLHLQAEEGDKWQNTAPSRTHQFGLNLLALVNLKQTGIFGEKNYRPTWLTYRYVNKSGINPFINFGLAYNRNYTGPDPVNGTVEVSNSRDLQWSIGADHRFAFRNRWAFYPGFGTVFLEKSASVSTRFNNGTEIQETTSTTKFSASGFFASATFEFRINPNWSLATRMEYRKTLETESKSTTSNKFIITSGNTSRNYLSEKFYWPFQLLLQYNLKS